VVAGAHEFGLEHEESSGLEGLDLVADSIQQVQDLAEKWSDIGPGYRVRARYEFGQAMKSLRNAGWRARCQGPRQDRGWC